MFLTRLIKIFSTKCYILPLKTFSSIPTFKNFGLKSEILDALEQMNIHTPSPIQSQSISHLLKPLSENVYIAGQTGTGKTLAYLLPILHLIKLKEGNVKNTVSNRPYAILLMPSKELVEQTLEICKKICHFLKLRTIGLSNIHPFSREKNGLDEGADIVVTTIDRLEKHRKKQNIFLSNVNYLVIDEADTFLDSGYKDSMEEYINILSKNNAKIIYVSATFTNPLNRFFESIYGKDSNYLKKIIEKKTHMNLSNLKHEFIHVKDLDKQTPLIKILKEFNALIESTKGATMIFCNSVPSCQSLEYRLKQEGFDCISLHGDIPKNIRIQNIRRFRTQEINILISTDLGARGLDFPFLNHVINFDFPKTTSDYLHRAGRAGRAGKKGYVTNLYHSKDNQVINELKESHENNSPVKIGGSAYMLRKGESIKKSNSNSPRQQRLDEKTKKLLPSSYNEFKKEWEDSKEGKENRKHFIPEKKENLIKLKQLKKEKKNLRKSKILRQGKQMISVQRAIKRTNRSISYAKTKLNSKSKKSRK